MNPTYTGTMTIAILGAGMIGFGPVDTGTLRDGRKQEPGTAVYNRQITKREILEPLQ